LLVGSQHFLLRSIMPSTPGYRELLRIPLPRLYEKWFSGADQLL
jgi:hypothetical protein